MITYVATAHHTYTMEDYLRTWGRSLAATIRVLSYDDLFSGEEVGAGTFIFSDLERLSAAGSRAAARVWSELEAADAPVRLLNAPARVLRRQALLERLHEAGLNRFRSYRLTETQTPERFPVFLRDANEHEHFTPLLGTQEEVDRALAGLCSDGRCLDELLMVEFCDVSDSAGLYRKYSAFWVADRLIPRHLIFSRSWVLKEPDLIDDDKLREEWDYLETNPHCDELRRVFELANVDYGRIDYGVKDGCIQAWEINTNPIVMLRPERYHPAHLPVQEPFAAQIEAAFRAVDTDDGGRSIPVTIDADLRAQLARERELLREWSESQAP